MCEKNRGAYQAWNFTDRALQSEAARSILKRCKSPREAFGHLEQWYDPESEVATQKLYDKFCDLAIPPKCNPIEALHGLEDINKQMAEKEMGIPDTFLHARFICALPDEHSHVEATLQAMKNRDRTEIIGMVSTRYSPLPQKKGSQRSSRPLEQAFFSSESGGRSGARRKRSRGGSSSKGGGCSSKGRGSNCRGGSSSVSSASGSSYGGGTRTHARGCRCNGRDHIREECTTKESDFLAKCARCLGFGHEESICSSDAAGLAMELAMSEDDLAVETQAFVAKETGKCRMVVGEEVGGGELGKQVVQFIADSTAICNMRSYVDGQRV